MFSEIQQIKADGSIDGKIQKNDIAVRYHIDNSVVETAKSYGVDLLTEVRTAIFKELNS